jgi:DegV family protein with EDD domain
VLFFTGKTAMETAIVADSIACIPRQQAEQYEIRIIPVNILFNGRVYRDFVDLSSTQAYEFLEKAPEFWKSSAASPEDYIEIYRELSKRARNILVITISSRLSAFHSSAVTAKEIFEAESPSAVIEVLDSETVAAAEGLIALAAARDAAGGRSFDEVVAVAKNVKKRVRFIGLLETISFVYRTGRIPRVASEIGSMLNIKPILTGSNGNIHIAAAARSKQSGINKMLSMMKRDIGDSQPVHVAVMHADALEEAGKLEERIATDYNCVEIFITDFSPVMGYATGRGTLAVAYYKEDRIA